MLRYRAALLSLTAALLALAPAGAARAAPAAGWTWPVPGSAAGVVRGFDPPAQPWLAGHRGVDLAGHPGQTVVAAGAGVVAFAGPVAGIGVVTVRHPDGLLTTYQPVRPLVRRGSVVREGQQIGRLVRAGSHCWPQACLHWGLRRDADYLDPLALVGAGRVRLLPLHLPDGPARVPAPLAAGSAGLLACATGLRAGGRGARGLVSRAGRRACRAAGGPPWCASGRSGSR
ncbi:MAG TPA: peptidoglycan DD-metalloendopeptidase family protein [Mycobacteriales bacterium]|nr:peptidoglycan DD-metalloendopeptidase family protein [Mycobacteriales bacterium]